MNQGEQLDKFAKVCEIMPEEMLKKVYLIAKLNCIKRDVKYE